MSAPEDRGTARVSDLSVGYGSKIILKDVSFEVHAGEVFAILGRSGSGKSTLLKCLIGLLPPLSGTVCIGGRDLFTANPGERRDILRQIGVLFQGGALFGSMTVLENVRLPLEQFTDLPRDAQDLAAIAMLRRVGLEHVSHSLPTELSGGMQKRAALARAMVLDPNILFLDEPSVGLDPITSASLDDLIRRLSQKFGITFVIVTHELESLFAIATRAIFIDAQSQGIVAEGSPAEMRDHPPSEVVRGFFHRQPESESK